jgi:hypothetical protein
MEMNFRSHLKFYVMNVRRLMTALCTFSIIFLFVQCEKEEMILHQKNQQEFGEAQDPHAKKPEMPPGQDKPDDPSSQLENVVITGDVSGVGLASTEVREESPFDLTLGDTFGTEAGTFTNGEIRILYGTKKHGENRIDFWYTDVSGVDKYLMIREPNPNDAYDPDARALTFDGVDTECIIAIRDGTGENYDEYPGVSATVVFIDD